VFEKPLRGDIALLKANKADRWGNLTYIKSARNFNPVMAMAAELTVVEVDQMVELGEMDPEAVVTPSIFCRSHRRCWSKCMIPLTREQMAWRAAQDLQEGAYCQSRHRHSNPGGKLCAAGARSDLSQRERHPRHGSEAGAR